MSTVISQVSSPLPTPQEGKHREWERPLEDKLYTPDPEALAFWKAETGIEDEAELKQHILTIQKEAFSVYAYPCIRVFEFMKLKLARLPAYDQLLRLPQERENAIFLDLGCCCEANTESLCLCCHTVGNDTRKLVRDGWPVQNVIASDLQKDFWTLGHKLFRSTPTSFPALFIPGDIFDPSFLSLSPPPSPSAGLPLTFNPSTPLTSLNPLRGHISAIFTGAFFHLFPSYDTQTHIARLLASLLSPLPGSMVIGVQGGLREKGFWTPQGPGGTVGYKMACHSPESWREMWEEVFREQGEGGGGEVEVRARLREEDGGPTFFGTYPENTVPRWLLEWAVIRK
ncbi:hypothetical protein BC835DRAFT_1448517 [Cytidiella melzeri]|nr:hypothetical protein BC835DRAFT_1448517 [Cytidiella melzeri]